MTIDSKSGGASRRIRLTGLLVAGAVLAVSAPALAAPTARDCATASEEGLSLRKQEKLSASKDRFLVCSDAACPAEIRDECSRRVSEVTEAIPSVVFEVRDAAGNDMSAVRVSMDGALLVDHLGAAAVPIDPGEHTFRFEADQAQPVEKKFVIRDGEKNRHLAVAFGSASAFAGAASPSPAGLPSTGTPGGQPATPEEPSTSSWSSQKTWAIVIGGAGIVGIGVGSVFGLNAFSKWSDAKAACATACGPNDQAQTIKSDASSAATVSTIAFVAGGVAVAGAALLWFTAPSGTVQVSPTAGPQAAGMSVRGVF